MWSYLEAAEVKNVEVFYKKACSIVCGSARRGPCPEWEWDPQRWVDMSVAPMGCPSAVAGPMAEHALKGRVSAPGNEKTCPELPAPRHLLSFRASKRCGGWSELSVCQETALGRT